MSCQAFESMIALDAGGDLPAPDAERLERHLSSCGGCRRFAAEMRDSQQAVALLADAPVDGEVLAAIRAGVLREVERSEHRRRSTPFRLPPRVLALAAALAVALGALLLLRSGERSETTETPRVVATRPVLQPVPTEPLPATPATPNRAVPDQEPIETAGDAPEPRPPVTVSREIRVAAAQVPAVTAAVERPAGGRPPPETMVIKLVSEETDLVIYWLIQPPSEATKETTHEISAV